jgi:hypothetical protein
LTIKDEEKLFEILKEIDLEKLENALGEEKDVTPSLDVNIISEN